jgi:predicted membrane-bound mannosyltransferase
MLGYPLATDIPAPWISLHILLPLLIPAAVGWVAIARDRAWELDLPELSDVATRRRYARYALAALVVLSAVQVPLVLAASSITPPLYVNVLAQSAQPADDLSPMKTTVSDAANDASVLYYGEAYYLPNETIADDPPTEDENWLGWWLNRLPMAWYAEQANVSSSYARDAETLGGMESIPPVVFAAPEGAEAAAPILAERGYDRTRYDLGLYHEQAVVVFVDDSRLDGDGAADREATVAPRRGFRRA